MDMPSDTLPARLASEIASMIVAEELSVDSPLHTQKLAEQFAVSRSPIRAALVLLEERGLVQQRPNRGGYCVKPLTARMRSAALQVAKDGAGDAPKAYYAMAEDWLRDEIPEHVNREMLMDRYQISRTELDTILARAAAEGWIERKAGYGWRLLPVAKTPEAQEQLYRMRLLLEPAGLLEPTFAIDSQASSRLREKLERIRDGAHRDWPDERLQAVGIQFHEELARMSGNPFLHQTLVRVNRLRRLIEYRSMINRERQLEETIEHLAILEPVERGDLAEASFRMRRHVARALDRKIPSHRLDGFD